MLHRIHVCEESYLESYLNFLESVKTSSIIEANIALSTLDFLKNSNGELSISGKIGHIYINGFLSDNGPSLIESLYGIKGTSYKKIADSINLANSSEVDINEIYLHINSPGGNVGSIESVYNSIRNSVKPVTAFCVGQCCSGAYWIASAANKIISEDNITFFGSIGVVVSGYDFSEMYKKIGVRFVKIKSSNAPLKQAGIDTEDGMKSLQENIDAVEGAFISAVSIGRKTETSKVISDFGRGGVMVALDVRNLNSDKKFLDALGQGMIDIVLGSEEITFENKEVTMSGQNKDSNSTQQTAVAGSNSNVQTEVNASVAVPVVANVAPVPVNVVTPAPASVACNLPSESHISAISAILRSPVYSADSSVRSAGVDALTGKISPEAFFEKVAAFDTSFGKSKDDSLLNDKVVGLEQSPVVSGKEKGCIYDQASFDAAVNELV